MKFVIWFFKTTLFHILLLMLMLGMTISWEVGVDKTVALWFISITITVLVLGKLYYFRKNARESIKKDQIKP